MLQDMENLKAAMDEVNKTIKYINSVVNCGKLEVLPGSASVILETVMTIFTLLRYPQVAQDRSVYQSVISHLTFNWATLAPDPPENCQLDVKKLQKT